MSMQEGASGGVAAWFSGFLSGPVFVEAYPYYAAVLARMAVLHDPSVRVMAVSVQPGGEQLYLHVNVDYFVRHPQFLLGVLLHEVHHSVLGHLTHPRFRGCAHPDLMMIAMEVSANEYIREPLPKGAATWKRFSSFGLGPHQSTLERYEALARARGSGVYIPPRLQFVDDHFPRGGWGLRDVLMRRRGGSHEALGRLLDELSQEQHGPCLLAGRHPRNLLEELLRVEDAPRRTRVDWRRELERFASSIREPGPTYRRPNRRFPDRIGELPGRTRYGHEHARSKLMVVIDTSSSMRRAELLEIGAQLESMRHLADITICECDVEIARVYPFRSRLESVAGRGGTDLRPPFEPDFLTSHRPDGVVYFTDGQGPFPEQPPPVRTLWVLTKPGSGFLCPWGNRVALRPDLDSPDVRWAVA